VRFVKAVCDRCGAEIPERGTVVGVTAGELRNRYPDPLDFCPDCGERFGDWMRSGRPHQANHAASGGARAAAPVGLHAEAFGSWGFLHIPPKRYIPAIRRPGRAGLGSGPILG